LISYFLGYSWTPACRPRRTRSMPRHRRPR